MQVYQIEKTGCLLVEEEGEKHPISSNLLKFTKSV